MATGRRIVVTRRGRSLRRRRLRSVWATARGSIARLLLAAAAAAPLIRRYRQFHLDRFTAAWRYLDRGTQRIVNGSDQAGYVVLRDLPMTIKVVQGEREFLPPITFRDRYVAFEFLQRETRSFGPKSRMRRRRAAGTAALKTRETKFVAGCNKLYIDI